MEEKQLQVGDFVFAKVRGFRAWPARILHKDGKMYHVYFYGSCNIAKLGIAQLFEYDTWKERLGDLKSSTYYVFREAMEHVERSMASPDEDHGYFKAKAQLKPKSKAMPRPVLHSQLPFKHITGDSD